MPLPASPVREPTFTAPQGAPPAIPSKSAPVNLARTSIAAGAFAAALGSIISMISRSSWVPCASAPIWPTPAGGWTPLRCFSDYMSRAFLHRNRSCRLIRFCLRSAKSRESPHPTPCNCTGLSRLRWAMKSCPVPKPAPWRPT